MTLIQMQSENVEEVRAHFDGIAHQIQVAYSNVFNALTEKKIDRKKVLAGFRQDMGEILQQFSDAAGAVDSTLTDMLAVFELMDAESRELEAMRQLVEVANEYILPIEVRE